MIVFRDRTYRTFFCLLLLKGFVLGASLPFLAIWLTTAFGATPATAGFVRTATGITALTYGLIAARKTDRSRSRRAWIVGSFAVELLGYLALREMKSVTAAVMVAPLAMFAGPGLMFASIGDWIVHKASPANKTQGTLRMAFALGWTAGPTLGGALMQMGGARTLFAGIAAIQLCALLVAVLWLADAPQATSSSETRPPNVVAVVRFLSVLVLAFAADGAARTTLIPVYAVKSLGLSLTTFGVLLTICVALELPAFVYIGSLADRFGSAQLVRFGLIALAASFLVLATVPTVTGFMVSELLHVPYVAALHSCAMVHILRLLPGRSGLAMALYAGTFQLAPAVAAPLLGFAAARLSWGPTFVTTAALGLMAALLVDARDSAR